jgi:hypothetical protein
MLCISGKEILCNVIFVVGRPVSAHRTDHGTMGRVSSYRIARGGDLCCPRTLGTADLPPRVWCLAWCLPVPRPSYMQLSEPQSPRADPKHRDAHLCHRLTPFSPVQSFYTNTGAIILRRLVKPPSPKMHDPRSQMPAISRFAQSCIVLDSL